MKIVVPTVPGPPGICWKPQPLDQGMAYCGFKTGHDGRHTWEKAPDKGGDS